MFKLAIEWGFVFAGAASLILGFRAAARNEAGAALYAALVTIAFGAIAVLSSMFFPA